MRSYTFGVRVEEDAWPDEPSGYFVCVPELEHLGAATHGRNPEEAFSQHPRGPAPHCRGTGRGRNAHSH